MTVEGYAYRHGRIAKQHLAGAVSIVLCQPCDGDFQPEVVFHDLANGLHLPASTVGDDQIGERFPLFGQSRIAPFDYFAHGGVVVRPYHGFNMELPVEFFGGFELLENHTGRHGIFARDVGVIEEFDAHRQGGQPQLRLYFLH